MEVHPMGLSESERQELAKALLKAYPSKSALVEMVRYQFRNDFKQIPLGGDLEAAVFLLVQWAEITGKIAELIRASQQFNPQSSAVQEFVGSLSRYTRQDKQTVPASPPKLSASLRHDIVEALLLIPGIEDFQVRSELLTGIPWQANLTRGWNDVQSDLEIMVNQLDSLGQLSSSTWPLIILVDNARWHTKDPKSKNSLDRVYKRLQAFYKARSTDQVSEG
jgi:hypothetical protein